MFASSWKKVLCDSQLVEGKVEPGSPSVLVISASALRSLEMLRFKFVLLFASVWFRNMFFSAALVTLSCHSLENCRGLRILTKECQAVKLFSKHIKIDDQVTFFTFTFLHKWMAENFLTSDDLVVMYLCTLILI